MRFSVHLDKIVIMLMQCVKENSSIFIWCLNKLHLFGKIKVEITSDKKFMDWILKKYCKIQLTLPIGNGIINK